MKTLSPLLLLYLFFSFSISCTPATEVKALMPNIIIAIADDQSYPHTEIYGFAEIQTPAFNYVAQNGVLFHNAFVAAPQCSPSRAAMLTGKNIWELEEAGTHASNFPKKFKVFTEVLDAEGYFVGYTGKPWGPGNWDVSGRKQNLVGKPYNRHQLTNRPTEGIRANDYAQNFKDFYNQKRRGVTLFFGMGPLSLTGFIVPKWDQSRKRYRGCKSTRFFTRYRRGPQRYFGLYIGN